MRDSLSVKEEPSRRFMFFYRLSQLTWGLIPNIAGGARFLLFARYPHFSYRGAIVTRWNRDYSAAIGLFIFLGGTNTKTRGSANEMLTPTGRAVLVHEYGHTLQSAYLGPLFPILVGLPSMAWAFLPVFKRYRNKRQISYYSVYPENWANRLGAGFTGEPTPLR